ncbi:MAG: orotidine-5'-phosphate decarboxylase, partial [Deltaproteobacteria bacterium]|nr:orotidine-5'-phosphate decarboxylase [Deltaproteobacteria bacterium]
MNPKEKIIVALDAQTLGEASSLAGLIGPEVGALKVGLELLTSQGAPKVVSALSPSRLFFDGKFKDIPNTVAGASRAVTRLGVWMFNVHALGGVAMMAAAKDAAAKTADELKTRRPLILGVTILTSIDAKALNEIGFEHVRDAGELKKLVVRLSLLSKQAGLDGVVASPQEIKAIRETCGGDFLIVTPGIRPSWAGAADQKRIMTPREAVNDGADYLVIGRPITNPP